MKIRLLPILLLSTSTGCSAMNGENYKIQEVDVQDVRQEEDSTVIVYQTPMESLYFSPGVRVERRGDDILLTAVRCHIKKNCDVDVEATVKDASSQVSVPSPKGSLYWFDGDQTKLVK